VAGRASGEEGPGYTDPGPARSDRGCRSAKSPPDGRPSRDLTCRSEGAHRLSRRRCALEVRPLQVCVYGGRASRSDCVPRLCWQVGGNKGVGGVLDAYGAVLMGTFDCPRPADLGFGFAYGRSERQRMAYPRPSRSTALPAHRTSLYEPSHCPLRRREKTAADSLTPWPSGARVVLGRQLAVVLAVFGSRRGRDLG
jgi:hypothetical protein